MALQARGRTLRLMVSLLNRLHLHHLRRSELAQRTHPRLLQRGPRLAKRNQRRRRVKWLSLMILKKKHQHREEINTRLRER